jgi:signal transduction histidine kinase
MLEQAGEVIVVCDPEEMVVRASRQAFIVCDGNPLRRPFASAFPLWLEAPGGQPRRDGPERLLCLAAVADGQHVLAVKGRLQCEDHVVPVLASAVPLRGDSGELLGFVVTMTDVSQLEAAIKELEAFSYSVAHDLRSPLRAIDGFSRILLDEYASEVGEEARDHLRLVSDNAREMGQLVDGLLAFSRLGRQSLRTASVSPNDLIRQVLADSAQSATSLSGAGRWMARWCISSPTTARAST